jgi:hypothetical protein
MLILTWHSVVSQLLHYCNTSINLLLVAAAFAYCLNSGLTDPVFGMLGSCEHNMPFYNQYDSYINGDAFDIAFDVGVTASAGASFGVSMN